MMGTISCNYFGKSLFQPLCLWPSRLRLLGVETLKYPNPKWPVFLLVCDKLDGHFSMGSRGKHVPGNMYFFKCFVNACAKFAEREEGRLSGNEEEEENEDEDDAEAALKKEVDQIRTSTEQKQRRFQSVESGANNVVFIRTLGVEPEKLVHHILKDMHATKKKKTRVILRMLPVSGTCKAFLEEMKRYSETFFESWFKSPKKGTFQIVYKARNNSHLSREEVIKELAGIVGHLNPENKVDLSNPEFTIVVEIIKNICCLSVVKDYVLFRKYNLQEVVKSKTEGQPGVSKGSQEDDSSGAKPSEAQRENQNEHKDKTETTSNDNHED
ncbi:THUMP domain-containing protein 1 [Python bivittatus]|uniref:THUMP domain-containing protein 1 n=1 Tax=Python bivittatus TaxID=176946 RepID=A0A9F2KWB4_PYTBI|nr:THUMP domain-containing protein 1 [Python bivittatus]